MTGVQTCALPISKVLLPNRFSHPEIVDEDSRLLYEDTDELLEKIMNDKKIPSKELQEYVKSYANVISKWSEIMGIK